MLNSNEIRLIFINNDKTIEKTLSSLGGDKEIFNLLLKEGYLRRNGDNLVIVKDFGRLYNFALELINNGSRKVAKCLFNICFYYKYRNLDSSFYLFLLAIDNNDLDHAFKYYDILVSTSDKGYVKRANYILYIYNAFNKLPGKYGEMVNNFKFNDMCRDNIDSYVMSLFKDMIHYIKVGNYIQAAKLNNNLVQIFFKDKFEYRLLDSLLDNLIKESFNIKDRLRDIIFNKNYDEARNMILTDYNGNLKNIPFYKSLLSLLNILVCSDDDLAVPDIKNPEMKCRNTFDAIDNNDFFLALKLCSDYNKNHNIDNDSNSFYFLLDEICHRINSFSKVDKPKDNLVQSDEKLINLANVKVQSLTDDMPISILPKMSIDKVNDLYEIFKGMDGISVIIIGNDAYYKTLVIKKNSNYIPTGMSYDDYISLEFDNICSHYLKEEYDIALYKLLRLIRINKGFNSKYIAMLGNIYISMNDERTGKSLIELSKRMEVESYKEIKFNSVRSDNDLYTDDLCDDFGITFFDEFNDYMKENGYRFNAACEHFNLNDEDRYMICLLYAREYYIKGYSNEGNRFIRFVEQKDDKSERVSHYLKVVKKNEKFYSNRRTSTNSRMLSLGINPKK